jgi:hypothetical protein
MQNRQDIPPFRHTGIGSGLGRACMFAANRTGRGLPRQTHKQNKNDAGQLPWTTCSQLALGIARAYAAGDTRHPGYSMVLGTGRAACALRKLAWKLAPSVPLSTNTRSREVDNVTSQYFFSASIRCHKYG